MRRILPFAGVLLLASATAAGASPLSVDDAGTVDPTAVELEFSTAMMDAAFGPAHGIGVAARLGLSRSLDSGLAVDWFGAGEGDPGCEFVVDLKFAPGESAGWRPRPFLRSDLAVLAVSNQAGARFARLCGGLTWELGSTVFTTEACWSGPLQTDSGHGSGLSAAAGVFLPVHRRATLAAEFRSGRWGDTAADLARVGFLTAAGRGDLSFGVELPLAGVWFADAVALLGWTTEFGL